jgi:hypothetical protein
MTRAVVGATALAMLAIVASCRIPREGEPARDCAKVTATTSKDLNRALSFAAEVFTSPPDWQQSHEAKDLRVDVTWLNAREGGLAHLEYLVYPCGYTQAIVDDYFSNHNLDTIHFSRYEDAKRVTACQTRDGRLRLNELTGGAWKTRYRIRYWAEQHDATHVRAVTIAFPETSTSLDALAERLFPALPSCPAK